MTKNISSKIVEQIKKQHIKMLPKWQFLAKNWLFWLLFAFSVLLGSLAFSIIIFEITEIEPALFIKLPINEVFIYVLPLLWIFFLGIFIALAIFGIHHTKQGYKFGSLKIFSVSILMSLIFGTLIFAFDVGEKTDAMLSRMKFYPGMQARHEMIWARPERGLVGGEIIEVNHEDMLFILRDPKNKNWEVDYSMAPPPDIFLIVPQNKVRAIGEAISEDKFNAIMIKPWQREDGRQKIKKLFLMKPDNMNMIMPPSPPNF